MTYSLRMVSKFLVTCGVLLFVLCTAVYILPGSGNFNQNRLSYWNVHNLVSSESIVEQKKTCAMEMTKQFSPLCLRNAFSTVLLVVVFNYPFYDSIPLLEKFYKPAFPAIVYCGPKSSDKFNVTQVDVHDGYYGYECMGVAIRQNPGYKGYLYVNDDMIVNYWNLVNLDRDRIWLQFADSGSQEMFKPPTDPWHWWYPPQDALRRCEQAVETITGNHNNQSKRSLKVLLKNGGGKMRCYKDLSDFFYVPSKFSNTFQLYSSIFFNKKVFLEAAVPTIVYLLQDSRKVVYAKGIDLHLIYGDGATINNGYNVWLQYSPDKMYFIHPFKLHYGNTNVQKLNSILFTEWIIKLSQHRTQC